MSALRTSGLCQFQSTLIVRFLIALGILPAQMCPCIYLVENNLKISLL